MAFYIGEIRRVREEFFEAYKDGEYKKAILLGKNLLNLYVENNDCSCMEYAVDMSNLAMVFDQIHLYEKAAEYYEKAALLKNAYSGESLSYGDTLNNLAIVLNHMGRHEDALKLHHKVLEIRDAKLGREHMDYIHSLYHMGNTYELLQDMDKAIAYHTKALQQVRQCGEFRMLDLADLHAALARAYDAKGNFKKAIHYYELCIDLIEKARGTDHFYYMMNVLTLASVCEKAGLLDIAVEYCEKAVEIRRRLMSEEHLDFINSLNSLAALCCKDGQYDKALKLHREVLDIVERMLGKEHIFYADALNNLSVDYAGKKEFKKALALNCKALRQKKTMLGEKDPQVAACLMSMGTLYDKMDRGEEAMCCFEEALAIRKTMQDGKNTAYADTLTTMGKFYEKQKRYEEAEAKVKEALEIRKACGDESSGMYIWCLHLLAEIYRRQGENEKAIGLCKDGVDIAEVRFGVNHPRYGAALEKLGLIYETAGDLERAEQALSRTAQIRKEMLDEDNPFYLDTLEALARVSVKQKKYEKAIGLYREKNDVNFEETPQGQLAAANNLLAIANCHKLAGNADKAEAYFAEAEAKQKRCGLPMDETYEKRRYFFLQQKMEKLIQTPPKPDEKGEVDPQRAVEYYSALALSIRKQEGESRNFGRILLKTAQLHAKLGHQRDAETLLARVLSIGAKEGTFSLSFGKLCDRVGRIYAETGNREEAEAVLRQAYQIQAAAGKCMTREGHSLLLRLLREKGDEKAYTAVKNGVKLE